jgi:Ca2+-dependent lipid-binding protein
LLSLRKDERNSRIVLKARIGRGIVGVDVPVLVKEISLTGCMAIELKLMAGYPYIKSVSFGFKENPKINFILKPLKGVDLMDIPGLSNFLESFVRDTVAWLLVHPNKYSLDLDAMMNGAITNAETATGVLLVKVPTTNITL